MKLSISQKRTIKNMIIFIVSILMIVFTVSFILFSSFKEIVFSSLEDESKQLFNQMDMIMDNMKETIRVSGDQTLSDPDISAIRLKKEPTIEEELKGLSQMRALASSGAYTRSVYIYNQNYGHIYSSELDKSIEVNEFEDKEIVSALQNYSQQPRFAPFPHIIKTPYGNDRVYSFILFEKRRDRANANNALVINVFDYQVNNILGAYGDNIIAIDSKGKIVASANPKYFLKDIKSEKYIQTIMQSDKDYGNFISNIDGEKKMVMYTYSKDMDWYFVNTTSYDKMFQKLRPIKQNTIYILLALTILGFIIVSTIIIKIFMPFYKLVGVMDTNQDFETCDNVNDIANSFENIISKSQIDDQVKHSYEKLKKQELIKKYILGNYEDIEQLEEEIKTTNINIDLNSTCNLILILSSNSTAYCNYIRQNHVISLFEAVQINGDTIIIMQSNTENNIYDICSDIKSNFNDCIVYSDNILKSTQISRAYQQLLEISNYKIFYLNNEILGPEILSSRCETFFYPVDIEISIIKKLSSGKLEQGKEFTIKMLNDMTHYKYYDIVFSIKRMYLSIQKYYNDIIKSKADTQSNMTTECLERYISNAESFDEILLIFEELFHKISSQQQSDKINKKNIISRKIKEMIEQSYSDSEISLRKIGDEFGMSHIYIGRLFKSEESISVSEYINKTRIENSKQLLIDTKLSVKEISNKVGFTNENYFYPLFKTYVKMTPKEFRNLNKLN